MLFTGATTASRPGDKGWGDAAACAWRARWISAAGSRTALGDLDQASRAGTPATARGPPPGPAAGAAPGTQPLVRAAGRSRTDPAVDAAVQPGLTTVVGPAVLLLGPDGVRRPGRVGDRHRPVGDQGAAAMTRHGDELLVLAAMFVLVGVLGYAASRWRRPDNALLERWGLEEWGLGGRAFGNSMQFFLLGGDLYTAYSFIAVPALVYGTGAAGFYAVAFAVIAYPLVFLTMPRLWSVSHSHGFVSSAEFVRPRFGSPALSALVAITAILATLPYIALQLIGLRVVFETLGIGGDVPLTLAFGVLAFFTFNSGLRAPALLSILKDILLVMTVMVLLLWFTVALGGWQHIFGVASASFAHRPAGEGSIVLPPGTQFSYVSLALGSALSNFLYPHTLTGTLAARNRSTVRTGLSTLPAYTLLLGFFGLLGFVAIAAGTRPAGGDVTTILPRLLQTSLNGWGAGLAFAALGISALVPASIMSIGAANLFTRGIYREFINPTASPRLETQVSRIASVLAKLAALAVVLLLTPQFAVDLQLTGGVLILQILPAAAVGLHTNWF